MADVGKIAGPGSPSDPFSGKEPFKKVEAEKFKKYVEESDTEQKKKQKKPQKDIEDLEDDVEEAVASRPQTQDRTSSDLKFPKEPLIKEVGKTDERQKKQEKRNEETPAEVKSEEPAPKKVEQTKPFKIEKAAPAQVQKSEMPAATPLKSAPPAKVEKRTLPGSMPPPPLRPMGPPAELVGAEGIAPPPPLLTPPPPPPIEEKEEEEQPVGKGPAPLPQQKKEEKKGLGGKELVTPSAQTSPGPFFLPPAAPVTPGYASMKPEVFQLFERMVMAITVMNESGVTETTIHLNSADFTLFAGAQIVIKEYSTAPKAYNVEFLGNAQNTALFTQSAQDLVAAINSTNYNFKINRVETSLLASERPTFQRKEKPGEKGEKGEKDSREGK